MTTKYYALLTNQGAAKLANATALGTKLQITEMAVGDGGGALPTPDASQTKLIGEKRRAALNSLSVDAANSSQIIAEQIIPENEGGFWIREIGLFDADGVMIAVANCAETYKPQLQEGSGRTQTVRMIIIVNSAASVTLKIDPSVVLATRQYVDDNIIEAKQYADKGIADHVAAANPHKQYLQIANALAEVKSAGKVADVLQNLDISEKFSGRLLRVRTISESGSYTKPADASLLFVSVTAGGGGGGGTQVTSSTQVSAGAGGGAGGTAQSWLKVEDISFPVPVTVGKGGAGGIYGNATGAGAVGGSSSFGTYLSALSGAGGGNGGVVTVGDFMLVSNGGGGDAYGGNFLNAKGSAGGRAIILNRGYESGEGGSSIHSAGGDPIAAGRTVAGSDGRKGAGGGGAFAIQSSGAMSGGKGGDGFITIWEYS